MRDRDDFSASTRRILAERAGQQCSNPYCGRPTSGPSEGVSGKSTVLGKAAHITAAAERGARYDASLTAEQRKSVENGIWLCAECADRVDKPENAERYPVELLKWWKALQEDMSGSDMASVENRRKYPLRRLTIENFSGVKGTAALDFGALTIVGGTSTLSRSIGELVQVFCDREAFGQARQPSSGDTWEHSRLPLRNGRDFITTIRTKKPRHFALQGKLRLLLTDGREFECVVTTSGARFSLGGAPLPSFSPACRTVAVIENYNRQLYAGLWASESDTRTVEERIAAYFGISVAELLACIQGTPTDDSIFGYGYLIGDEGECHVKCGHHTSHLPIGSLSSGEKSRVILDVAIRVATYAAKVSPVVLLVHQWAVPSDARGICRFLKWIDAGKIPFQTVVDLIARPSECSLRRALCYETRGPDMEVTGFDLATSSRFFRKAPHER